MRPMNPQNERCEGPGLPGTLTPVESLAVADGAERAATRDYVNGAAVAVWLAPIVARADAAARLDSALRMERA